MHKKLYFWVALVAVFLFGMAFQSMIRPSGSKAAGLAIPHQEALSRAGVVDSDYQHLFVVVNSKKGAGKQQAGPITIKYIDGDIWGVEAPHTIAKSTKGGQTGVDIAEFTAILKKDSVVLKGQVDSQTTLEEIEAAAKKATGIQTVENQLVVGKNIMTPDWKATMPEFLTAFLSHTGVQQFTAEGNGLKLEGAVTRAAKVKLGQKAADIVPGQTLVSNNLVTQQQNITPILIAKKQGDNVVLTGLLGSEAYRTKLTKHLNKVLPDAKVDDQIQVKANVLDPWWATNAENLVPMFLSAIETDGSIEYWNSNLLMSGSIASKEISEKMVKLASGLGKPDDYSIESDLRVVPQDNPEVSLFRDPRGRLVVEGQVASTVFKNQILGGLMRHNPEVSIKDKLEIKDTVKDLNVGDPGKLVKELMFNVKGGMLKISRDGIKMTGETDTTDLKDELMTYATAMIGKQGKVDSIITSAKSLVKGVSRSAVSSPAINESAARSSNDAEAKNVNFKSLAVYFNSGRSTVRESQISNLRLTARILNKKIPNTKVIVGGYADHRGNASFNRELSLKRANTVRDILVSYGVSRDRMEIEHFGEDTSNTRSSDLWRSRRVELSLFNK